LNRCGYSGAYGKKAAVAVGHNSLVIILPLLNEGTVYNDGKYDHPSSKEEKRQQKRAIDTLQRLGFEVTLKPAA
jgi:hypothetical protein